MFDLDRDLQRYTEYLDELVEPIEIPVIEPDRAAGRPLRTRRLIPALGAAAVLIVALGLLVVLGPFGGDEAPFVEGPTTVSTIASEEPPTASTVQSVPDSSPLPEPPAISWTRYNDPAVFGGERQQVINGVTAVPGCAPVCGEVEALIAVGFDRSGSDDFTIDAAAWVSSDGRDWRRVVHDEASLGGDYHEAMHDVASNGERVVAVGAVHWDKDLFSQAGAFVTGDSPNDRAAIWLSDDLGETWQRVSLESDPPVLGLSTVEPFGMGFWPPATVSGCPLMVKHGPEPALTTSPITSTILQMSVPGGWRSEAAMARMGCGSPQMATTGKGCRSEDLLMIRCATWWPQTMG